MTFRRLQGKACKCFLSKMTALVISEQSTSNQFTSAVVKFTSGKCRCRLPIDVFSLQNGVTTYEKTV